MTFELGYKNSGLVFTDGQLCDNCCDAFIAVTDDAFGGNLAGLTALGTVRWQGSVSAFVRDVVKTSTTIYRAQHSGVVRASLSNGYIDTLTTLNCNGIDVDSSGNIYIAHLRAGAVSVTKVNSAGVSQWTYDTGGNALKIKLNADESQVAVVGDRADNGGGNKTLWVLATSDGVEQWTFHDADNPASTVSVDWDAFGNVYIVVPVGFGGCRKIDSSPAQVWQWDICTEVVEACIDLLTYTHVVTDSVYVYLSVGTGSGSVMALTVCGDVGSGEGRRVWGGLGGAAAALDANGNLFTDSPGGDVYSIDPSTGDTIWTASSVRAALLSIHAGSKPGALPWGCNNTYIEGDLVDNGGTVYQCKANHISCGPEIWHAKVWTVGDRCYWLNVNDLVYILENNNKDGDDTTPPDADADWVEDNDEPGVGNHWADYWD